MSALHLVYQHWFLTILLACFGVTPVVRAIGQAIALNAHIDDPPKARDE